MAPLSRAGPVGDKARAPARSDLVRWSARGSTPHAIGAGTLPAPRRAPDRRGREEWLRERLRRRASCEGRFTTACSRWAETLPPEETTPAFARARSAFCDRHHEDERCWGEGGYEGRQRRLRERRDEARRALERERRREQARADEERRARQRRTRAWLELDGRAAACERLLHRRGCITLVLRSTRSVFIDPSEAARRRALVRSWCDARPDSFTCWGRDGRAAVLARRARERAEQERYARESAERDRAERERLARESAERDRAERERYARLEADREEAQRRAQAERCCLQTDEGRAAPPGEPPAPRAELRPPPPSVHAEWIPGSWRWNGRAFGWLGGFWRVPETDRERGETVSAPREPPAPVVEVPPAKPDPGAVWTAGHWQWDGRAFVWVAGLWRLPPTATRGWRTARWVRQGATFRFDPGTWLQ